MSATPPAQRGHRVFVTAVDDEAQNDPSRVWAAAPQPGSLEYRDISISTFARAINRISWWMRDTLGQPPPGRCPTVAYVGPNDLRYPAMLGAAVKTGYAVLMPSYLNKADVNTHLLQATDCSVVLHGFDDSTKLAFHANDAAVHRVPDFAAFWADGHVLPYPYDKSFDQAKNDPLTVAHTSGTTSLPKPLVHTHFSFAALDQCASYEPWQGRLTYLNMAAQARRVLVGFSICHSAGALFSLAQSVFEKRTIVLPPADRPVDAPLVLDVLDRARIDAAVLIPNVVDSLAGMPEAVPRLQQLVYLMYGGAPILQQTGDTLASKRIMLLNAYGSSEMGWSSCLVKDEPADWSYYFFRPGSNGFDMRPLPGTQLHELVVVRDATVPQQVFRLFPDAAEWPTRDLFEAHPTRAHHWRIAGRTDDIVVLNWARNFVVGPLEAVAAGTPGVAGAVAGGTGRPRLCLLLEPADWAAAGGGKAGRAALTDAVWARVQHVNERHGDRGKLVRALIVVATEAKPLPRTGKGTVPRKAALKLYEAEFDAAYAALDA